MTCTLRIEPVTPGDEPMSRRAGAITAVVGPSGVSTDGADVLASSTPFIVGADGTVEISNVAQVTVAGDPIIYLVTVGRHQRHLDLSAVPDGTTVSWGDPSILVLEGPAPSDWVPIAGPGVPTGGSTGQVLAKASGADYDTAWVTGGGGGAVDSVNGETGVVVLDAGDVDAVPVTAVGLLAGERNRGEWSALTAYSAGDVVHDHAANDVFVATAASLDEQPSLTPGSWDEIDGIGRQTALGPGSHATGMVGAAFGFASEASGDYSTAVGPSTSAAGEGSTAVGPSTSAAGDYSTAVGVGANASGYTSTAVGFSANASGAESLAMGQGTSASGYGSTAVGQGVTADEDYEMVLGTGGPILSGKTDVSGTATEATNHAGLWDMVQTAVTTDPDPGTTRLIARAAYLAVRDSAGDEQPVVTGDVLGTATPLADGTAAVGVSVKAAREDHVHPASGGGSSLGTVVPGNYIGSYPSEPATGVASIATYAKNCTIYPVMFVPGRPITGLSVSVATAIATSGMYVGIYAPRAGGAGPGAAILNPATKLDTSTTGAKAITGLGPVTPTVTHGWVVIQATHAGIKCAAIPIGSRPSLGRASLTGELYTHGNIGLATATGALPVDMSAETVSSWATVSTGEPSTLYIQYGV